MKITKSRLKQLIKEELSLMGALETEINFVKKHKLNEAPWADKYKALETETLAKLQGYPEEDVDVLSILADAVDSHWFLRDDEDKSSFIWDIVSAKPELGDAQELVDDVFQKLNDSAYADHLSQQEDEATNPW